jgi:hypothetical protein
MRWRTAGLAVVVAAGLSPATASAAGLVAAYDRYEPGKGFEIGLVNVGTGQAIPVPAAVNTTDDELHPTLSPDGRFLVFMRMRLLPKLNGDIVAPPDRALFRLDRQSGAVAALNLGAAAGPVFTGSVLAWGIPPVFENPFTIVARHALFTGGLLGVQTRDPATPFTTTVAAPAGQQFDVTHAAVVPNVSQNPNTLALQHARYLGIAITDATTGALVKGLAELSVFREEGGGGVGSGGGGPQFGAPGSPASHPVARKDDRYTALDLANGDDVDIQTISSATETTLTPAPSPITTSAPERMPAWSPDGIRLGFVRTANGRRTLVVFDATPGIQNALNAPIDIGADAPTPQTRAFQSTWGGLSLALSSALDDVPTVTCVARCLIAAVPAGPGPLTLLPRVSLTTRGQTIGIFVARVIGTRKLLGRTTPRIRVVGRVPLGRTVNGVNRFRWNGEVAGRRLTPGTYLLTYRALKKARVLSVSGSIRVTVAKGGKVVRLRPQK